MLLYLNILGLYSIEQNEVVEMEEGRSYLYDKLHKTEFYWML
jgi:hypothetical protein